MRPSKTAIALVVLLGGALVVVSSASGCSSDDDDDAAAPDASTDAYGTPDADPCNTYTSVGKACNVQPSRRCFPLCQTGGCFCQGGVWACVTDESCFQDASFFEDSGSTPVDASSPSDASTDADADG